MKLLYVSFYWSIRLTHVTWEAKENYFSFFWYQEDAKMQFFIIGFLVMGSENFFLEKY